MLARTNNLISLFVRHPVAANLLMFIMILSGAWALLNLNTQFLPRFHVNIISIKVVWSGASAEDIEKSITRPIEQEMTDLDGLKKVTSTSRQGVSSILLEFEQGAEMSVALQRVQERVSVVRELPADAESAQITKQEDYEPIARLLITSNESLQALRPLVYQIEDQLLAAGIAKIDITGLPDEMIAIQVPAIRLAESGRSLTQIAKRIAERSQDLPAGTIGRGQSGQQLRGLQKARSVQDFEQMAIVSDSSGRVLRIKDIATVQRMAKDDEVSVLYQNKPAVEMKLLRTGTGDALESAGALHEWLDSHVEQLPAGVELQVYFESWRLIHQRIFLLLKNGAGGLLLILGLLFLFLNRRIAFWVAMGIPVSFLATLAILFLLGGSINMVSLFAMIMALGIIVDDTIVVGEESLTQLHAGKPVLEAVEVGANKMLPAVLASSLTTICAFLPLLLIGDVIGTILSDIPKVVICVIIASVIECFLVLPGHLYQSFRHLQELHSSPLRSRIDAKFFHFRENIFRPFVERAIKYRWTTIAVALGSFVFVIGLVVGGRVPFNFFPSPDGTQIFAQIEFNAGTPTSRMQQVLQNTLQALWQANQELKQEDQDVVLTAASFLNKGAQEKGEGNTYASINVELTGPDNRKVRNQQFIDLWQEKAGKQSGVANLVIAARRAGPPGQDIDVKLIGADPTTLKQAALELRQSLRSYAGITSVEDDLPFGQQQAIFSITPEGQVIGLTVEEVGRQLRAAFTGQLVQIYHERKDEVEVRVLLPEKERYSLDALEQFPIVTATREVVPLKSVVDITFRRGFDILRHDGSELATHVFAQVDPEQANSNVILKFLQQDFIPSLAKKYSLRYSFAGKAEEQAQTLADMKIGMLLALIMIYIILSWVFASYAWPLIVMVAIPLGLVGAIFGHWILGMDLTILSLFGFFGLSGIVINDSIILIMTYKRLREKAVPTQQAITDAACKRLRAVLLTSLTTIAGLTPLLFETSLQAQFLIPMAISITFGLAFSTLLILIVIPALLSLYEGTRKAQ